MANVAHQLTRREEKLLIEIQEWVGLYSVFWTEKTRQKLVDKGLADVCDNHVRLTEAGAEYLKKL